MSKALTLTLARKFALLGAIGALLFCLPLGFYVQQVTGSLRVLQAEQAGIDPALSMLHLVQLTQQHRGLFNAGLEAQRAAKQAEAAAAFSSFAQGTAPSLPTEALARRWSSIQEEWQALSKGVAEGAISRPDSLRRHTALVEQQLQFVVLLTESYRLAYDPEPRAHHIVQAALVELPRLTEALGQARARGAAYLAAGRVDPPAQAAIATLVQEARSWRAQAAESLRKSSAAGAETAAGLPGSADLSLAKADEGLSLVAKEVLGAELSGMAPAAYFQKMTEAVDAAFSLQEESAGQLRVMFQRRVDASMRALLFAVAGIVAAGLTLVGFGFAIFRSISVPVHAAVRLAQRVAQGDLTVRLDGGGSDEIGQLQQALSVMVGQLRDLLAQVVAGAESVSETSAQIAQGNTDLSQRTEEQASTLEETASSMEELTATVARNADGAREASQHAAEAAAVARQGGAVVQGVVATMNEISSASARIRDITVVIDGIAFQTNILALNAAVEAARAGVHGRGFAVVATEVRSLSQRCASAAREIKALISDSAQKVESGAKLVETAGSTMQQIVASVEKLDTLLAGIAAAGREQSAGIGQINTAVSQMDLVVQQNASLVEEAAAATESMKQEASALRSLVTQFRLDDRPHANGEAGGPRARASLRTTGASMHDVSLAT